MSKKINTENPFFKSTERVTDMDKLIVVNFTYGGKNLGSICFSLLP